MKKFVVIIYIIALTLSSQNVTALETENIDRLQQALKDKPLADRIAFWAEQFVGSPYDPDPLGEYVRREVIVSDERVDCMYHVFRSAELALSSTPEQAIEKALDMRFHTKGILQDNTVLNYSDRFQYGEDMILSGKWGNDISAELGKTTSIKGSRGQKKVKILLKQEAVNAVEMLKNGDIVFFIKDPKKRVGGEIVGHIGIIKTEHRTQNTEHREIYLIHASGVKGKDTDPVRKNVSNGVKKVLFADYLKSMKFIGIKVTRFKE
ncbi:MAG: hypothetical protein HZC11_02895 [Nitrospirae bacterium]|nr:hypothetical protein [Nitrospirota bacterium]